ncbi:MAG TPA: class I SAM-dependent RNA methyltransferase [Bryobacteraceae bacterium]|nr:class I SAM-dependent RNA methyltransferase [Bryobacteraceae bacterium]
MPESIELTIEKLVYGGHGLSRVPSDDEDARARVVLVPLVLPGERVSAEPVDKLHARLLSVHEPSPDRIPGPCPYFGVCGGCQYQHMPYEKQLQQKKIILAEVLERTGKLRELPPIRVVPSDPWQYRNRTQLHVQEGSIGYLRMGTHELCPVDHCPISSPQLNAAIQALSTAVADRHWPGFIRRIELFSNGEGVQFNVLESDQPPARRFFDWLAPGIPGYAPGALDYEAAGHVYRVSPRSFFQVNRSLVDAMAAEALGDAQGEMALDLYAGVGLFSLPLAQRFNRVTAVESSGSGAADLRHNASRAGLQVNAVRAEAGEYLLTEETAPDFVLADPPREGLGKAVVRELLRIGPKQLNIVACDPATLGRDLRALVDGGYRLEALTLLDLFPQTYHIETVAKCVRD